MGSNFILGKFAVKAFKSIFLLLTVFAFGCIAKTATTLHLEERAEVKPQYFISPLPASEWRNENVLNYNPGYFTFPPPAGFRIMQYSSKPTSVVIDLHRETLDIDTTFAKIIRRRQGGDHCDFNDQEHEKRKGMDMVQVEADCYRWHSGEFKRKYYFLRSGNLVFTFRMISTPDEYNDMVPEFDHFVYYTVAQYMQYPAEQDMLPYEHYAGKEKNQDLDPRLIAFFNPNNTAFSDNMTLFP